MKKLLRGVKRKIKQNRFPLPIIVVVAVAVVGVATLLLTQAASSPISFEAEAGASTANACSVSDANASGGQAVKFSANACAGGGLSLARIPWEGGPNYWKASNGAQFTKTDAAGWDDPSFLPVAVFYGKPSTEHVLSLKDAGINTLAPVEHNPPLTNVTNQGLFALPGQSEWTQNEIDPGGVINPKAVGYFISDECDMIYGNCPGGDGSMTATQGYDLQQARINELRAFNDGRFMLANFGNGILRTFWSDSTITRNGLTASVMTHHVHAVDAASADKYTYTSPDVAGIIHGWHNAPDWPDGVPIPRAYSYGWQADQMRRFQDPSHLRPVWTFVETAKPYLTETGSKSIELPQIEGAVWSALIHEARGIYYFQHNNSPTGCTATYSIVECTDVHNKVKEVNAKVRSLASVLNTQSYYNTTETINGFTYYRYRFNNGTDTMLKAYNGSAYIFAGLGMRCNNATCTSGTVDTTGSKTFTLPTGVNGTSVEVVGEGRTIPISNRQFTDTFAQEYTHHVYKISLN